MSEPRKIYFFGGFQFCCLKIFFAVAGGKTFEGLHFEVSIFSRPENSS